MCELRSVSDSAARLAEAVVLSFRVDGFLVPARAKLGVLWRRPI